MTMTISIAADVVRARIQAMTALHIFMHETTREPLTEDNAPALNQLIAGAFGEILFNNARNVVDYKLTPSNFYRTPSSDLFMEVTLELPGDTDVSAALLAATFEEYIAARVLEEIVEQDTLRQTYGQRAIESGQRIHELFTLAASGCRLKRAF